MIKYHIESWDPESETWERDFVSSPFAQYNDALFLARDWYKKYGDTLRIVEETTEVLLTFG